MSSKSRRGKRNHAMAHQNTNTSQTQKELIAIRQEKTTAFSGPIPPPDLLKGFEEVLPGLADRIVRMAETQATHRQDLEASVVKAEINRGYLGMASGLVVAMTAIIMGGVLMSQGHIAPGGLLTGGTLATLVGVFVHGWKERRKEREEKSRIMANTR